MIDHHPMPNLLCITGWPATGKTTLAKRLAAELKCPLFTKDEIKERLFDTLGVGDREWSSRLSSASYALCLDLAERTLAAGLSCIVEANFKPVPWAARIQALIQRTACAAYQVHCRAPLAVIKTRFNARARHPGHLDHLLCAELEQRSVDEQQALPLNATLIDIDTSLSDERTAVRLIFDQILTRLA